MRRDFALPEQDVDFLESTGYQWETIQSGANWVIIHNYPVPVGYNINTVNLALMIEGGYPVAQIDMVYFLPHLQKNNGSRIQIGALAIQNIQGNNWQRWSR